jgi:hypothetical protein
MSFEFVTVRVDEPSVDIPVYRDLICSVAPYFHGAFNSSFREAEDRTINLPDVRESTFRAFLEWCHLLLHPSPDGHEFMMPKDMENDIRGSDFTYPESKNSRSPEAAFDQYSNALHPLKASLTHEERRKRFYNNDEWLSRYARVIEAFLDLYIFADKYSVDQLRDDLMSALAGYCLAWRWWPDIYVNLTVVNHAYANLPSCSRLIRYLVSTMVYMSWIPSNAPTEVEALKQVDPMFTFDIMMGHALKRQGAREFPESTADGLKDSCVFHEHRVFGKESCRERLGGSASIFKGLANACIKAAGCNSLNDS